MDLLLGIYADMSYVYEPTHMIVITMSSVSSVMCDHLCGMYITVTIDPFRKIVCIMVWEACMTLNI